MKQQRVWHAEFRQDAKVVYVIDPSIRGRGTRYIRTHRCAMSTRCPACSAHAGIPCHNIDGEYVSEVHQQRKDVFYKRVSTELKHETYDYVGEAIRSVMRDRRKRTKKA